MKKKERGVFITEETLKKIKDTYESNKEELEKLSNYIKENNVTDYGLDDVSESFEQGYNNALEYVFGIIGISY